jgi:hypothetical protein
MGGAVSSPDPGAGPGRFFVRHPAHYGLSLTGAAAGAMAFAARAVRSRNRWQRLGWIALSCLQVVTLVGIRRARRNALRER